MMSQMRIRFNKFKKKKKRFDSWYNNKLKNSSVSIYSSTNIVEVVDKQFGEKLWREDYYSLLFTSVI